MAIAVNESRNIPGIASLNIHNNADPHTAGDETSTFANETNSEDAFGDVLLAEYDEAKFEIEKWTSNLVGKQFVFVDGGQQYKPQDPSIIMPKILRYIAFGMVEEEDYVADRVTIYLGEDLKVSGLHFG